MVDVSDELERYLTDRFRAAAESRLRAARLFTEDPERADFAYLSVEYSGIETTVSAQIVYYKRVTDAFGESRTMITWRSNLHGGGVDHVKSRLSELLDDFLTAYLRVNEAACSSVPARR